MRRFIATLVLFGAMTGGADLANAMLCESDLLAEDQDALSSKLEDLVPPPAPNAVPERPSKRQCDSYSNVDCDLNMPEGSPESPRPITGKRPIAALAHSDLATANTGRRLKDTEQPGQLRPGFASDIFRPPRRW